MGLRQECSDLLFSKWYEFEVDGMWQSLYSFLICTGCFPFRSCLLLRFKYSQCLGISPSPLKMIQSSEASWGIFTFLSALIGLGKAFLPWGWQGVVMQFDIMVWAWFLALPQTSFVTSDKSLNLSECHVHALLNGNDCNCSSYLLGCISLIKRFPVLGQHKNQYFFSSKWVCHSTRNKQWLRRCWTLPSPPILPASSEGRKGDIMCGPSRGWRIKGFPPFQVQSDLLWCQKGEQTHCTTLQGLLSRLGATCMLLVLNWGRGGGGGRGEDFFSWGTFGNVRRQFWLL